MTLILISQEKISVVTNKEAVTKLITIVVMEMGNEYYNYYFSYYI